MERTYPDTKILLTAGALLGTRPPTATVISLPRRIEGIPDARCLDSKFQIRGGNNQSREQNEGKDQSAPVGLPRQGSQEITRLGL